MFHKGSRNNKGGMASPGERVPQRSSSLAGSPVAQHSRAPPQPQPTNIDPRRLIVDHIVRDCYSRAELVNGQKVPETRYNTHLNVREYSQHPQKPPPEDQSPAQNGPVKSRILVICTKHSGRVLLQKGKFNDEKRIYQIGRTWDLEELKCITRLTPTSMILLLNKDYYWESGEGEERMKRFLNHLVQAYHRFTNTYPQLQGLTLADLGMSSHRSPTGKNAQLGSAPSSSKTAPSPQRIDQAALYRDMDFTANGKLPMKPMQVMDVDRPGSNSPSKGSSTYPRSAQASVPAAVPATVPTVITSISAPNRSKFLQDAFSNSSSSSTSDPAAAEVSPISTASKNAAEETKPVLHAAKSKNRTIEQFSPRLPLRKSVAIDELEEQPLASHFTSEKPLTTVNLSRESVKSSWPISMVDDSAIDTSIREIEDFMDSQFGSHKKFEVGHRKNKLLQYRMEDFEDAQSTFSGETSSFVEKAETPFSDVESVNVKGEKLEKDPEVDELLDEIGWKVTESSENFVRQLNKELALMKRKNVEELIYLDFGKDKLANEGKVCSDEISNLVYVFKKMEVGFQRIASQISDLERNSKGLQMEAVNNKILFNDLNEILNKVKVNSLDLQLIANYDDFEDLAQIPILEMKLLALSDALLAIGSNDNEDGLSRMQALKQYQEKYEDVAMSFVSKFVAFIHEKFSNLVIDLGLDIDNLFPRNILKSFLKLTPFVCVGFFVKCISPKDVEVLNENFNSILADFLGRYFTSRLKLSKESQKSKGSRLSLGYDSIDSLSKRRSARFGSNRLISRMSLNGVNEEQKPKIPEPVLSTKDSAFDHRTIMRVVQETRELILVVQYFCCNFFHSISTNDFSDYLNNNPYDDRAAAFDAPDVYLINYKSNSNELLTNMNSVFGNYINSIVKNFAPSDLQIPRLLIDLQKLLAEARAQYQDFVAYSFLRKLIDRYKNVWVKFISNNVSVLQKSDVRAKSSLLPGVKNLNVIILSTETILQDGAIDHNDENIQEVLALIEDSYEKLTDAMVDLFGREDPLLKYNAHDEKERAHRNVVILQNLFCALQQLSEFNGASTTTAMRLKLQSMFNRVQNDYTVYLLRRFFGKMYDFVAMNTESEGRKKKDNKILIKALVSSHTTKETSAKIIELHHKLERHFLTTNTVFEQDLLAIMWKNTEEEVVSLFLKFFAYAKSYDRDIDECITIPALRSQFKNNR